MTVQELMTLIFQLAGEPSDCCPYVTPGDLTTFDATLAEQGAQNLLTWVNMGVARIANWKYGNGTILRFPQLKRTFAFRGGTPRDELVISATDSTVTVSGFSATTTNRLNQFQGWLLEVLSGTGAGQKRLVVETTGENAANCVLRVEEDWTTNPDATSTVRLTKRFFNFVDAPVANSIDAYHLSLSMMTQVADVLRVIDLSSGTDLARAPRTDLMTGSLMNTGIPSLFLTDGSRLTFDVVLASERQYQIFYYAHPERITTVAQSIPLPLAFHEAVMYWVVHMLQLKNQDFNGAYAIKRELQELMQTLRNVNELTMETENAGVAFWG